MGSEMSRDPFPRLAILTMTYDKASSCKGILTDQRMDSFRRMATHSYCCALFFKPPLLERSMILDRDDGA